MRWRQAAADHCLRRTNAACLGFNKKGKGSKGAYVFVNEPCPANTAEF